MTPRALSLSFLLHTEPFDLHFHKWKTNLSLSMILWLPCNWPTGKFASLSYISCKCLHISLSDIKAVTIIYVTTRLIRKRFQVLGIWAQRDGTALSTLELYLRPCAEDRTPHLVCEAVITMSYIADLKSQNSSLATNTKTKIMLSLK